MEIVIARPLAKIKELSCKQDIQIQVVKLATSIVKFHQVPSTIEVANSISNFDSIS
jgi:hypothetical protein